MRFFTGKGDNGRTNLNDSSRIAKNDPRLDLIGSIDELNANIGFAISLLDNIPLMEDLKNIQELLSKVMGLVAGTSSPNFIDFNKTLESIEKKIQFYGNELNYPNDFTFPGKTTRGAAFDICRTVTRRSERQAINLIKGESTSSQEIVMLLNRLSSFFFVLRLFCDKQA